MRQRLPFSLCRECASACAKVQTGAEGGPHALGPSANTRQNSKANSENYAEEGGVFDESRAALVFVQVTKESYKLFHGHCPLSVTHYVFWEWFNE